MSLLAKLSSMASTRSWPFRMSSCCLAISCRAIRVSWSAMARRSLAAWARLALTCSEIMIDSCGRVKMVSSSGHGVFATPTMLPRKEPGHEARGDADEHVHRAAELVHDVRDPVQQAGPADVLGQHQPGLMLLRVLPDLQGALPDVRRGLVDGAQRGTVCFRAREPG